VYISLFEFNLFCEYFGDIKLWISWAVGDLCINSNNWVAKKILSTKIEEREIVNYVYISPLRVHVQYMCAHEHSRCVKGSGHLITWTTCCWPLDDAVRSLAHGYIYMYLDATGWSVHTGTTVDHQQLWGEHCIVVRRLYSGKQRMWSWTKRKIKELQTKEKVGRRRSKYYQEKTRHQRTNQQSSQLTLVIKWTPNKKKKFSPWMIQKCFTQELCNKLRTIRSKSESEFVIEVNNKTESKTILSIDKLNNVDVRITECTNINQSQG